MRTPGSPSAAPLPLKIVALEPGRIPEALEIFNHYVRTSTALFIDVPISEEAFRDLLFFQDARYGSFAISRGGKFWGYVTLRPHSPRSGYRHTAEISIFLRPGCTGQGAGSAAIAVAESRARERGFHALVAGISGDNEASLRLFERQGYLKVAHFREVGLKFGRWLDTVYCEKLLT